MKYAEVKTFSIRVDLNKSYKGEDYDKIFKVLSTLKNKILEKNNTLIEIYKDMLENPNFKQNKCSITSSGIYKIGYDSI